MDVMSNSLTAAMSVTEKRQIRVFVFLFLKKLYLCRLLSTITLSMKNLLEKTQQTAFFFFLCRSPYNRIFRLFSNIILGITLSVSLTSSKHTCQLFPLPTFKSVTSVYRQMHKPVLHLLSGILCVVIEGLADLEQSPCATFLYCTLWMGASDARVCGPPRARRQPTSPEHNNARGWWLRARCGGTVPRAADPHIFYKVLGVQWAVMAH